MTRRRRLITVVVAAVGAIMLMAGPASAHFCYNASRSAQGNTKAGQSAAWISVESILRDEGLCDEGVDHVLDGIEAAGYPRNLTIHGRTVMAGGAFGSDVVHDGRGVDHIRFEDFDEFDRLVDEAIGICAG